MNEITVQAKQLPDNLPDLAAFVLVGREKLTAVRAEIRAIDKLQLAEDVRQQKRDEAQMLSEALLDAEVRIGELTKAIPKAPPDRGNQYTGGKPTALSQSQMVGDSSVANQTDRAVVLVLALRGSCALSCLLFVTIGSGLLLLIGCILQNITGLTL